MKKNLMSVIILALVLADLILTALLAFTIIPQTRKSNELIDQICAAINIELEGGWNVDGSSIPIEDKEVYDMAESFTVNLADGNYAVFSVGLVMNKKSDGYGEFGGSEGLSSKETLIRGEINSIVSAYTVDEFNANGNEKVKSDILKAVQKMFGSNDFIVEVSFSSVNTQRVN